MSACDSIAQEISDLESQIAIKQATFLGLPNKAIAAEIQSLSNLIKKKNLALVQCLKGSKGYETQVDIFDIGSPQTVVLPGEAIMWKLWQTGQTTLETQGIQNNAIRFSYPDSYPGFSLGISIGDSSNASFTGPLFRSGPYSSLPPGAPNNPDGQIFVFVPDSIHVDDMILKARLPNPPIQVDSDTTLLSLSLTLVPDGVIITVDIMRRIYLLWIPASLTFTYTLKCTIVPSWNMNNTAKVCEVLPAAAGTITNASAFFQPFLNAREIDIRTAIAGALQSQLNAALLAAAAANPRFKLPSNAVLSMREVIHSGKEILFFPAIGLFGLRPPPPPEDPRCAQIRSEVAKKQSAIDILYRELDGLDPKRNKAEFTATSGQIVSFENDVISLKQQATSLGCQ